MKDFGELLPPLPYYFLQFTESPLDVSTNYIFMFLTLNLYCNLQYRKSKKKKRGKQYDFLHICVVASLINKKRNTDVKRAGLFFFYFYFTALH